MYDTQFNYYLYDLKKTLRSPLKELKYSPVLMIDNTTLVKTLQELIQIFFKEFKLKIYEFQLYNFEQNFEKYNKICKNK